MVSEIKRAGLDELDLVAGLERNDGLLEVGLLARTAGATAGGLAEVVLHVHTLDRDLESGLARTNGGNN